MTLASRLLHASSLLIDSLATPSAMIRKILGRLELSGPRTIGLLLWRRQTVRFQIIRPVIDFRSLSEDTWTGTIVIEIVYLSIRSHKKSNVWTASSLSSLSGNQLSQWGRTRLRFTHSDWNLMTFPTAEMQFSVALTFSLDRASVAWMTPTSKGIASGKHTISNLTKYN